MIQSNRLSLHFDKTYFIQSTTKNRPQIDLYISCAKKLISKAHDTTFLGTYVHYTVLENSY
jgi:polynucleotide 5'-kinase involved in rRNA processing